LFANVGFRYCTVQVLFLGDMLPTGWQTAVQCDIQTADTVAVWAAGRSAIGAQRVGGGAATPTAAVSRKVCKTRAAPRETRRRDPRPPPRHSRERRRFQE
jgi:hypothetical protein